MGAEKGGRKGLDSAWYGFLAVAVATVGLTGLFASYAARLPLERALHRVETLDAARAALGRPDSAAALEALRPALAESAEALLPPGGDMAARIATEQAAVLARFRVQAEVTAQRLRWLIGVITIAAAGFGMGLLGMAARQRGGSEAGKAGG